MKLPTLRTSWLERCKPGDRVLVGAWSSESLTGAVFQYNLRHARTVRLKQRRLLLVDPVAKACEECWLVTAINVFIKEGFVPKKRGRPFKNEAAT